MVPVRRDRLIVQIFLVLEWSEAGATRPQTPEYGDAAHPSKWSRVDASPIAAIPSANSRHAREPNPKTVMRATCLDH